MRVRATGRSIAVVCIATLLAACGGDDDAGSTQQPTVDDFCSGEVALSFALPADVGQEAADLSPADAQTMFDCFAWRSFVALNWPAASANRGEPDPEAPFARREGARVWETYKEVYELFQAQNPSWDPADQPWNAPPPPVACSDVAAGRKVITRFTKAPHADDSGVVNEYEQAFATGFGTLTDQNGNLVRYEVRYNRDEFEFIRDNGFAKTGNYDFGGPTTVDVLEIAFPDNTEGATGAGSIEVKASWRELTDDDDPSRYYWEEAVIFDPADTLDCRVTRLGLIGLHVTRKTEKAPQWVWATFEHVDNVPPVGAGGHPAPEEGRRYSLFDATCDRPADCWAAQPPLIDADLRCCPNLELNPAAFPQPPASVPGTPNQVTRVIPVAATDLNRKFQQALAAAGSPFRHYELVSTQWPLGARDSESGEAFTRMCNPNGTFPFDPVSSDCYTLVPPNLRNTSMETYMVTFRAGTEQFSSDSCMGCHGSAGVDSSYVWLDASTIILPIGDG